MEEKNEEFLKMIGLTGTKQILEFIHEHGTAQYKDFQPFVKIIAKTPQQIRILSQNQHIFWSLL